MRRKAYIKLREAVKKLVKEYSVRDLVAEIHNLYQDYLINEKQEEELYNIADPKETENSPAELWYSGDYGCAVLYDLAYSLA